jgi:hypothetical protein
LEDTVMVNIAKCVIVILAFCLGAVIVGYANRSAPCLTTRSLASSELTSSELTSSEPGQDIMSVDRRVTTLEQHMYTLDSNLNQLQQQIMMLNRTSSQPPGSSAEVQQLRIELDVLRSRMAQVECALAKLDERTLTTGRPKVRAGVKDPCRLEPQAPIEITGHPY